MKKKHIASDIFKIILVLAGVEYGVMHLLSQMGQWDYIWMSILLDASILSMVSTTILYFWLKKPTIKRLLPQSVDDSNPFNI